MLTLVYIKLTYTFMSKKNLFQNKKALLETATIQIKDRLDQYKKDWRDYSMLPKLLKTSRIVREDNDIAIVMYGTPKGLNSQTIFWKDKGRIESVNIYNSDKLVLTFNK